MKNSNRAALVVATAAASLMVALSASHAAAQCGRASWYALHSKTASGERMNPSAMTAAHRSLPFGTKLKVTNKNNGKSVVVRINDRGPFIKGRVLDLSKGAASQLGFIGSGHTSVCMARV
jgi:rare lipoprotein A